MSFATTKKTDRVSPTGSTIRWIFLSHGIRFTDGRRGSALHQGRCTTTTGKLLQDSSFFLSRTIKTDHTATGMIRNFSFIGN